MRAEPGEGDGGTVVPPLPGRYVDRPGLLRVLDAAAAARLAVVTGGPGWGKTTAVAAWAGHRDACWLTLDRRDSAVPRLANRILHALRCRLPDLPAELVIPTRRAGPGRGGVPIEAVSEALREFLAGGLRGDLILVLDGLQDLPADGDAVRLLAGLADRAPAALRLAVVTEPGPQWPAGWPGLAEGSRVGPEQLAFSVTEVAEFLQTAPDPVDPAAAGEVWELTSGWPAAVRLAAETLRAAGDEGRRAVLRMRTQGRPGLPVLDELAAEVLAREPEPARRLLAAVAVLGTVEVPVAEALGHREAAELLPALAGRGLLRAHGQAWAPVGPVRDLLGRGERPDSARVRTIQTRAAAHHLGRAEYQPALRHLVAAADRAGVEQLLIAHGEALLAEGEAALVLAAGELFDLPGRDLRLLAVLSHARQLTGDWLGALALLRAAAGTGPLEPALALQLGQLYYVCGQLDEAVGVFERASVDDGGGEAVRLLCQAAAWYRAVGADDRSRAAVGAAAAAAERSGDPVALARSHWALALLAAYEGDRAANDVHHRRGLRLARQAGNHLLQLGLQINRASYLAEEGTPAEALAEAESALELGRALGVIGYQPMCLNIRARAKARLGRFAEALADVEASQRQWQDMGPSFDVAFGLVVRGDVHCRRGEPGQAQAALVEALRSADGAGMRPLQALALASLARARAADDAGLAGELAEQAVTLATGTGKVPALLASGWVALLAGDQDAASRHAAAARSVAGARRDRAGLAEALELAVLAAPDPQSVIGLLAEAGAIWAELGDPVGQARTALVTARLSGPVAQPAADAALSVLQELGVRVDSGVADALAVPAPQPPITVRTLGAFQVLRDGTPIPAAAWRSKKARDLFKILLTQRGRPVSRERLIDLLWPHDSADRTGNRLSVLLSTLRTVLDPDRATPEPGPVLADRDTVALDLDLIALDVDAFLTLAGTAQTADRQDDPAAGRLLSVAAAAYTGDFLPENPYDEWAEPLRGTARTTQVSVLRALIRRTTDPDQRELHLLQLLDHDPYDEQAHRQLVRTLQAAGRHGEATRRYQVYAARMAEIGITPTPLEPMNGSRPRPEPEDR